MAQSEASSVCPPRLALVIICFLALAAVLSSAGGCSLSGKSLGETIDDATITAKIKLKFAKDPVVSAMRIDVDTFRGKVFLTGSVKSKTEQERAVKLARETAGVIDVESRLIILQP